MGAPRFFTKEWAEAVREAVNRGPTDEYRGTKLDEYWDWIANARQSFEGQLAFAIREDGDALGDEVVVLTYSDGACSEAQVIPRTELAESAFVLAGDRSAWHDLLSGYDAGKTVMYRRLLLTQGNLLAFFNRAYFFVELLALVGRVPTDIDEPAAA